MATNDKPTFSYAYLCDKVIEELQTALKANLLWLDVAYGRCERLVKSIEGKRYYTPNVYAGKDQYLSLLPDDVRGCYSFFVMREPQEIVQMIQNEIRVQSPFSLIVWVDMRKVEKVMRLPDERNTEYVKEQILSVLNRPVTRKGSITLRMVYERAENVFNGFTLDEVDNQYLMSPFAGFRFDGVMTITNDCNQ